MIIIIIFKNATLGDKILPDFQMEFMNVLTSAEHPISKQLFDKDYTPNFHSQPRNIYKQHDPNKKFRNVWLFRNSSFKNWNQESEELNANCFLFDWKMAKMDEIFET